MVLFLDSISKTMFEAGAEMSIFTNTNVKYIRNFWSSKLWKASLKVSQTDMNSKHECNVFFRLRSRRLL